MRDGNQATQPQTNERKMHSRGRPVQQKMFSGKRRRMKVAVVTRSTMAENGVPIQMRGRLFAKIYAEYAGWCIIR